MVKKTIHIPITEQELEELQRGKRFEWVFDGIECHIYKEE